MAPEVDAPELTARMGGGFISAVVSSPAGDATAFVWSPRRFPMWYRLGVLRPHGEIVLTAPELRIWGPPRWAPSGHLAVGGFAGIRRVVFDVDVHSAATHLITSGTDASYELVEYVAAGHAQCRRRALDGSVLLVVSRPDADIVLETEHAPVAAWRSARLVRWDVGHLRLEGMLVPPADGDPPWETVTFLHGGPVATLAIGEHDRAGAWADPRRATFIPEFPASGICGESAMLGAFEARELPGEDHEVDAILAGIDTLVAAGLTDARKLYLVGHSYGGYLVNRALTRTNRFRAAVCWEGVADVRSLDAESLAHHATWRGGTPLEVPERWSAASPIDRATRVSTPVLLFYGASSRLVTQGERWHDALQDAGATTELVIKAGAGHTFDTDESAHAFHELVAAWFRRAAG